MLEVVGRKGACGRVLPDPVVIAVGVWDSTTGRADLQASMRGLPGVLLPGALSQHGRPGLRYQPYPYGTIESDTCTHTADFTFAQHMMAVFATYVPSISMLASSRWRTSCSSHFLYLPVRLPVSASARAAIEGRLMLCALMILCLCAQRC
jgi:hypothetical protein